MGLPKSLELVGVGGECGLAQGRAFDDQPEAVAFGNRLARFQRFGEPPAMATLPPDQPVVGQFHEHAPQGAARHTIARHQLGFGNLCGNAAARPVREQSGANLVERRARQARGRAPGAIELAGQDEATAGHQPHVAETLEHFQGRTHRRPGDAEGARQDQLAHRRARGQGLAADVGEDLPGQFVLQRCGTARSSPRFRQIVLLVPRDFTLENALSSVAAFQKCFSSPQKYA